MDKKVFSSKLRIEQVVLVVCIIMLLAIILQSGITGLLAKSNVEKSGTMLLNQIESVINDNSSREDSHTEELKETYVSYAKTIAYILALNPDAVYDITELKNIAELQHVDEVHIFDTEGTIISGTEPKYYGYSFDSGEQMGFFKPMLNDKNLTLAQDIMPNTAEGKSMMYTMVWSPDNNFMVEVGVEPHRFLSEVEENSIENVIRHIPVVPGYDIYAVDLSTYEIVSSTNELVLDSSLISGFAGSMSYDESGSNFGRIRHKGEEYYASYRKIGNYMIATVYSMNESSVSRFVPVVIMALFMGLAGLVIFRLFSRLYKVNEEEARQVQLIREYSRTMSSAGFGMWHIILKDGEAPRMQVNGKMAELLGIEPSGMTEEQIYDSWYERVSPEALDSVSKSVEEMLSGHFSENTYRWNHPEKGLIDVRCGGTSEKKDDDSFVLSGYHADVTNLVIEEQNQKTALSEAKEAAEAADKAKSAFLFNMSHDIRTPMNAIVGYTELILKNIEDKERCIDYVQKIKSSSELLVSIINNVLEMARIESNKTSLNETATRAGHISDEVCAIYTELMKEKNIEFVHSYDVEPEFIYVDRVKTREILLNLISNAYKYTHSGGKVSVSFKGIPSEKEGYINIRTVVSDTGVGMSESFLPKIFEEFSRDDSAVANQIQGTGLGMPIVKKFTELMGGTISVKSELGKGTEFVLEIPHRIAKGDSLPEAEIEIDDSVFRGKRVLLAEDNELNAEISTVILEDMGFKVERAENGQIAVNMVADHPDNYYDIVLMDIQMPIMSGYDATKQIRAMSDIKKAYVPIVAMTANAFEEDRRRSLQNGMDAHIAKPLQLNVLRKTLAFIFARDNLDESYTLRWKNRFADCEGIMSFEQEYRAKGKKIGWLIYEAYGKEKIRFADKNLIEICGCHEYYEFLEYVNGSFKTLVHPDDIERVEKEIETQISTSDSCMDRVRYRIICKDGVTRTIDDIGHKAFVEDGMPVFYVAIVDVTE